jgi:YfiH family protein
MALTTVRKGDLEYLVAPEITVPHCFTTRFGGVSKGSVASLNLGMHRGDAPENVERNYAILAESLGFSLRHLVLTRQTHSDIVRKVSHRDANGLDNHNYPECDALITNEPGTALVVFTADCTPILLQDPVTGAVGAIHAGWRGTAAGLAEKTVLAMVREFGCDPANIRAAIGPNIGACCFQTDADVPAAMRKALGEEADAFITQKEEKYYLDLKRINAAFLQRAGVRQINIATECTFCQSDRFWSHRKTGGDRGSQGAIIVCKEGTP